MKESNTDMGYKTLKQYKVRDTRFGRKPRNAVEALRQARDFLVAEGKDHWIKGSEMTVPNNVLLDRKFDPEDPACGKWGVCAIGAVALVTGDMQVTVEQYNGEQPYSYEEVAPRPSSAYLDAVSWLDEAAGGDIVSLNDTKGTKRQAVIKRFNEAIDLAKKEANERRGRNAARTKFARARKAVSF